MRCRPQWGYVLVIAEKPKAASKIAEALGGVKCRHGRVPYWVARWMGQTYVIVPAAGHLFGLTTDERGFPVFTYYWAPLWVIDENSRHTRYFFEAIRALAGGAKLFVNACDYDIEGSVIGYNILKALNAEKRALRAKFSALTKQDIRRAFERLGPLDWDMIEAGLARHELDWIWGINVSRALMEALRAVTNRSIVLSAGRVQSPTLLEAVRRSMERRLHVPVPYFTVKATLRLRDVTKTVTIAVTDTIEEARSVASNLKASGHMVVGDVKASIERVRPPYPFNLGDLQAEASRIYGYSPYYTQRIAEELYLDGLISYPRTNSQQIPPTIDVRAVVDMLRLQPAYRHLIDYLLSRTKGYLKVNNGPKVDPAHPAIHPTGERPRGLSKPHLRVYDLIVRRFLASMMPPAKVERVNVTLVEPSTGKHVRLAGIRVVDESWMKIYYWLRPKEDVLPRLLPGEKVKILTVKVTTSYTDPPQPHTKASLVRWMEARGIGTEATRARIVELLFERKYLSLVGKYVYSTELGDTVAEILERYFPKIVSVELTREFEIKLESIRAGRLTRSAVVNEAKKLLHSLLTEFKNNHLNEAGRELAYALGMIKPPKTCPICGRKAEGIFCKYHLRAFEKLREAYMEWKRRTGISCIEFLEKIASMRSAGNLVRDVANHLLKDKMLASLLCRELRGQDKVF